jgi:hypothetical protein
LLLVVVGACTFTVGVNDLQNADCGAGKKACPDSDGVLHCVGLDQPQYGCSQTLCAPCSLPNATQRCDPNNNCAVAVCTTGFAHCDSNPHDGCEANVYTDINNCGLDQSACGSKCDYLTMGKPNVSGSACINGVCQIGGCTGGYQDCNKMLGDGCECGPKGVCNLTTGVCAYPDAGATD